MLIFLALAGGAKDLSAQAAALQVQVYDYADLSPATLHEFIVHTQGILAGAGVLVKVDACQRMSTTSCESRGGSTRQVVLRILAGAAPAGKDKRWEHLGQSFAGHDGGVYATIFLQPAKEQAAEASISWTTLLAHAAAHEVGHLLLGAEAHTPHGLMKGHWQADDFQAMAQNRLHFTAEQIRDLTSRYGTAPQVESGAGNVAKR